MISPEMLRRYGFFAGLTHADLKQIAMISAQVSYEAGEWMFYGKAEPDYLYILISGSVDLCLTFNGYEEGHLDYTTIGEGQVIGWSALVAERRFSSVRARTPVTAIAIDGARLLAICEADKELGYTIMSRLNSVLFDRLCSVTHQLVSFVHTPEPAY